MPNESHQIAQCIDGKELAKHYRFHIQPLMGIKAFYLPLDRVPYVTFYAKHSKLFDRLAQVCLKHRINGIEYIRWCATVFKLHPKLLNSKLLDIATFNGFFQDLKVKSERKQIFARFKRSAQHIADECIKHNYPRSSEYFQKLIREHKLAQYYMAGKVSKHFLAAIPKFQQIVEKLDDITQDEMHQICANYDKYHQDVMQAMMQELGKMIGPFSFANLLIEQQKKKDFAKTEV